MASNRRRLPGAVGRRDAAEAGERVSYRRDDYAEEEDDCSSWRVFCFGVVACVVLFGSVHSIVSLAPGGDAHHGAAPTPQVRVFSKKQGRGGGSKHAAAAAGDGVQRDRSFTVAAASRVETRPANWAEGCGAAPVRLFIAIQSSPSGGANRQATRDTWLTWAEDVEPQPRHRFFIHQREGGGDEAAGNDEDDVVVLPGPPGPVAYSGAPPWAGERRSLEWALGHSDMTHYLSVADDGLLCPAAVVAELQTRPANRFAWARYDCAAPFLRIHSGFLGLSRDVAEVLVESQTLECVWHRENCAGGLLRRSTRDSVARFEAMFWALRLTVLDDSYRILPASLSRVALENEQERNFCKSRIWAGSLDTLSAGGGRPRGFLGAAPARPATTTTPRTAGAYAVGAGRTIMPARNAYGQRTGGQFAPKTPAAVEWQGATAKQNLGAVPPAWANAAPSTGFNGAAPRTGVKAVCNGGKMCIQKSTGPPFCWASRRCKETARSAAEAASGAEAAPGAVGGRRLLAAEVDDDRATPRRFAREGPADAPRARPARDGGRRTGTADDDDDGAGEDRQPKRRRRRRRRDDAEKDDDDERRGRRRKGRRWQRDDGGNDDESDDAEDAERDAGPRKKRAPPAESDGDRLRIDGGAPVPRTFEPRSSEPPRADRTEGAADALRKAPKPTFEPPTARPSGTQGGAAAAALAPAAAPAGSLSSFFGAPAKQPSLLSSASSWVRSSATAAPLTDTKRSALFRAVNYDRSASWIPRGADFPVLRPVCGRVAAREFKRHGVTLANAPTAAGAPAMPLVRKMKIVSELRALASGLNASAAGDCSPLDADCGCSPLDLDCIVGALHGSGTVRRICTKVAARHRADRGCPALVARDDEARCARFAARAFRDEVSTVSVLSSFPGSGNTWLRRLLEFGSGIYTGSIYDDAALMATLPAEGLDSGAVLVVKAHISPQEFIERIQVPVTRVLLLVRNPLDAIWSEYQRRAAGGHVGTLAALPEAADLQTFALKLSCQWMLRAVQHSHLAALKGVAVDVVRYEDLVQQPQRELQRALRFLGVRTSERRADCAVRMAKHASIARRAKFTARDAFGASGDFACALWRAFQLHGASAFLIETLAYENVVDCPGFPTAETLRLTRALRDRNALMFDQLERQAGAREADLCRFR